MKVFFDTHCCDISRSYISGLKLANNFELTRNIEDADIICYIGCAYTSYRIETSAENILKLLHEKKENQSLAIFGCETAYPGFQQYFKGNPHIDFLGKKTGQGMQLEIAEYLDQKSIEEINYPGLGVEFRYPHRLNIVVEDGCNKRCAFCKSNYLNLHLKSMPMDSIVKTLEFFAIEDGISEVLLTGLNVSSYGNDLGPNDSLIELIRKISAIKEIDTILLDSLSPDEMSNELLKEIVRNTKIKRVMIPIQCMSNDLLKRMGRCNTAERAFEILNTISTLRPDIFIETIFLICYPTETIDDIKRNIELLEKVRIHNPNLSVYCYGNNVPTLKSETEFFMNDEEHQKNGIYYRNHMIPIIESQRREFLSHPLTGRLYYKDDVHSYFSTICRFTTNEFTIKCPNKRKIKEQDKALLQSTYLESVPEIVYRTKYEPTVGKILKKI